MGFEDLADLLNPFLGGLRYHQAELRKLQHVGSKVLVDSRFQRQYPIRLKNLLLHSWVVLLYFFAVCSLAVDLFLHSSLQEKGLLNTLTLLISKGLATIEEQLIVRTDVDVLTLAFEKLFEIIDELVFIHGNLPILVIKSFDIFLEDVSIRRLHSLRAFG